MLADADSALESVAVLVDVLVEVVSTKDTVFNSRSSDVWVSVEVTEIITVLGLQSESV